MKIASLDLTADLFIELCKATKIGPPRRFIVKANPLPDDAEVEHVEWAERDIVRLYLTSKEFEDVDEPPQLPPVIFETIFDEVKL